MSGARKLCFFYVCAKGKVWGHFHPLTWVTQTVKGLFLVPEGGGWDGAALAMCPQCLLETGIPKELEALRSADSDSTPFAMSP